MESENSTAKLVRGLVKTIFILCYAAFMWASIHHVATYFNNFEQGNGDIVGSYLLAGAFDITALVTTIGVMFFRKSMPKSIQSIVWAFILGIAAYSFFVNWEYAAHFQSATLILQPTGETTPVYDLQGNLHYVMVMKANTTLLFINPLLASGFTVFSLIYSVVAEFFGTKAPTVEELLARKQYLEETQAVRERIRELEDKGKGKGLIAALTDTGIEVKEEWKRLNQKEEVAQTTAPTDTNGEEVEQNQGQDETETALDTDKVGAILAQEQPFDVSLFYHSENALLKQLASAICPNKIKLDGSISAFWIPLETLSRTTGYTVSYLRRLVAMDKVRTKRGNPSEVLASSFCKYVVEHGRKGKETSSQLVALSNQITDHSVQDHDEVERNESKSKAHSVSLGMIEERMYNVLCDNPETLQELLVLAEGQSLDQLTAMLRTRYSNYADYITPERVQHILDYVRAEHTPQLQLVK